jgi:hypothetical protein
LVRETLPPPNLPLAGEEHNIPPPAREGVRGRGIYNMYNMGKELRNISRLKITRKKLRNNQTKSEQIIWNKLK